MKQEELISTLKQIKALAEKALNIERQTVGTHMRKRPSATAIAKKSLQGHILQLREGDFFKQAKTVSEVHSKIYPIYPCERNRVAMALLRLLKHKELRRASKFIDKEKQIAYVW